MYDISRDGVTYWEQVEAIGPVRKLDDGYFAWTVTDTAGKSYFHRTSRYGDGIFVEVDRPLGTEVVQIAGTCDLDLSGVSASTRRRRLVRWYGIEQENV